MYFENRFQAGELLADILVGTYRNENCAVVALSDGAVQVGEPIASALNCMLTMLLIQDIRVPGEIASFGGMSQDGGFAYNDAFSEGQIEEYTGEFHGFIEEQKREAFQKINRLMGQGGVIDHSMLQDRVIILVADGLDSSISLDVAVNFLKPVRVKRLIAVTPVASIKAVDKLHILADELHVLDVKENFMGTDHYYDQNDIPSHEETIERLNTIANSVEKAARKM